MNERKKESISQDTNLIILLNKTDLTEEGAGREIIKAVEALAVNDHKERVRLDCSIDNPFLNQYYESMGYEMAGTCKDGGDEGNRRENIWHYYREK